MYSKTTGDLLKTLLSTDEYSQFQALKGNSVVSLAEHLETLLNQKRTSKAEVIYRAKLDTVYGYQIFNGTRKPSRDKLLQLAFGFPLTYKETLTLLRIAGVGSLYVRRRRDSIIIFALNKGFSLEQLNALLEREGIEQGFYLIPAGICRFTCTFVYTHIPMVYFVYGRIIYE